MVTKPFTPRPWQRPMLDHLYAHERCALWAGMGMGKTGTVLSYLDGLYMAGESAPTLILGPKRVARSTWSNEARKWDDFKHLGISPIIGTEKERLAALRRDVPIYTVNYESMVWLIDHYGDRWPFKTVIADECFVAGTTIATPDGPKAIETLKSGAIITTMLGPKEVTHVFRKKTKALVRIHLSDGREIVTTPSHRFWTESGWREASRCAGLAVVCAANVQAVRKNLCDKGREVAGPLPWPVLRPLLRNDLLDLSEILGMVHPAGQEEFGALAEKERIVEQGQGLVRGAHCRDDAAGESAGGCLPWDAWGQRRGDDGRGGSDHKGLASRLAIQLPGSNSGSSGERLDENTTSIQAGFCMAGEEAVLGSRRAHPQNTDGQAPRLQEDLCFRSVRVDRVESIELAGPEDVWDLEVEDAHHFFAAGVLVHNCTRLKGHRISFRTSAKGKEFLAGQGTKRAGALAKIAHAHVDRFVELTGTPAPNGLIDLWGQVWMLDRGKRLGRTFDAFKQRWFHASYDGYGSLPNDSAEAQIHDAVKDICLTIAPEDWLTLDEPVVNNVMIDLPASVKNLYRQMEKDFFIQIEQHTAEAFNAAAKSQKLMQLASGAVYLDPTVDDDSNPRSKEWKEVHDEKVEALQSIVEESAGERLLVVYEFRSDLARLLKAFPQGKALTNQTEQEFREGKLPILFIHPKSAGHGIDGWQAHCHTIVFFSVSWNLEERLQVIERVGPVRQMQSNTGKVCQIHNILAEGTIDELVLERVTTKRAVQDILLEACKRKR